MQTPAAMKLSPVFTTISIALAACGPDDSEPVDLDELSDEVVDALCAAQLRCNNFPDLATCREVTGNDLDIAGLQADIDAGVIDYDAEAARRCIDLFTSLITCELTVTGDRFRDLERTCAEVFTGSVADGGSCTEDEQCAGLLADCETESCPDQCCAGVCVTEPELADAEIGESCAEAPCVAGAYCDDETATCAARVAVGETCSEFDSCVEGALCDLDGTGTCFALAEAGETCNPDAAFGFSCLRLDHYCDPGEGVCKPRLGVGESCSVELGNCVSFAFCDAGTCAARPGLGDPCVPDSPAACLGDLECVDGACAREADADAYCPLGG